MVTNNLFYFQPTIKRGRSGSFHNQNNCLGFDGLNLDPLWNLLLVKKDAENIFSNPFNIDFYDEIIKYSRVNRKIFLK